MSTPTLTSWKGVTPIYLGNPSYTQNNKSYKSEPSGLTLYTDSGSKWIFMVSDNGILAKAQLPSTTPTSPLTWVINPTPDSSNKNYDYESVTFANGNLMIGVEGDRDSDSGKTLPVINRFDQNNTSSTLPAGAFTGSSWTLQGIDFGSSSNSGMEAMTLIPYSKYPSGWTNGSAPHYGGVFFVAVQAVYGKVYVYNLAQGGGGSTNASLLTLGTTASNPLTVPTVSSAPSGSNPLISDMFFDAGSSALYVLYDGGGSGHDYLQKLTISTSNSSTTTNTLTKVWDYQLPWLNCEGLAINGNDMYISVDDGSHPDNDGVFVLPGIMSKL